MGNFVILQQKLEEFIRKYYVNELIKGAILFLSIGLLYAIILLAIEHFLWLDSLGRSILFWSFVLVQSLLIVKHLIIPLAKLFKLSRGINYFQASKIIGNHFPEVKDKLLNVLQLKNDSAQSELLIASIEQKTSELQAVPFRTAVDFKSNVKYAKLAVIPILIILIVLVSGNSNMFSDSYTRVVNYEMAYEPPAPFSFVLLNENLQVKENNSYVLNINIQGDIIPENAAIEYDDETYFLKQIAPGQFQYTFPKVEKPIDFRFSANELQSRNYTLEVVKVPKMQNFEMHLNFPSHTGKKKTIVKGTGNATVPEGTKISWEIATEETTNVNIASQDSVYEFNNNSPIFNFEKRVLSGFPYEISISNSSVKNHEALSYAIKVIKDEYPKLVLDSKKDSVDGETVYYKGKVSDDYGISAIKVAYYKVSDPQNVTSVNIPTSKTALEEFLFVFPGNLELEKGESYQYYFQVADNDMLNGLKSVKSDLFDFRKRTDDELEDERMKKQKESIDGMDKSLKKMEMSEKELEEISRLQKEKKELDYNDRKKLKEFLKRQKQQEKLLQNFQEKLKDNLKKDSKENDFKKELERRLDSSEKKLEENEKLREELEKYTEKIDKEELGQKLEKMSKQNQLQQKSMEQLLELTKRYYVEEKQKKLAEDLNNLAKKQEELSEKPEEENTKEAQEKLTEEFEEFQKEMEELKQENEQLKKPMDISSDKQKEDEVKKDQKKAEEELGKDDKSGAPQPQKDAAKKMQQMSKQMKAQMQAQGGEAMVEDAKMLRQILDNLVRFSFEQETLLGNFKTMDAKSSDFSKQLREQNVLKTHFKHVDDSIYSLALRNPMVTENVLEKLSDVEFNIDKSLERLAENELPQGMASQQYVITGANDLALMLSDMLNQMQMKGSGSGGGKSGGQGFQLPDIIKKQGELGEQMEEGVKKGKKGKSGEGEDGKEGEGDKPGEAGKDGKSGSGGEGGGQGKGKSNNGDEQMSGEVFQIYQQQQLLKQQLKDRLEQDGFTREEKNLIKEMEEVEQDLLNRGFDNETLRKMLNVKHKLLELDKASFQQGEEQKREATTNREEHENTVKDPVLKAKEYFNTTEILNRQVLPLRQIYKLKVQEYFETGNN